MRIFLICFLFLKTMVFAEMSLDEKIGQLFVVSINSFLSPELLQEGKELIEKYHIGGVLLQQSTPLDQAALVLELQKNRQIPLLTLQDAEWGLSMRLKEALRFPKNLTLGAIQDEHLLYLYGREVARELKLVGTAVGLLPVVDVNTNPNNPIIGERSFGDDPVNVARKGLLVMKGIQDEGIFATAKHFPGHGDTWQDSHLTLPYVTHDLERLENVELIPFQALIDDGVKAVMIAHLCVPVIDQITSSLSSKVIDELLRKKMHFEGLVISDALNMQGIMATFSAKEASLMAFMAGCDILLFGHHLEDTVTSIYREYLPQAFEGIKQAVLNGIIPQSLLDEHVNRLLKAKESLEVISRVPTQDEIFPKEAYALKRELYRNAVTLVSDKPLHFPLPEGSTVVTLFGKFREKNFGLSEEILQSLYTAKDSISLIVLYASPYAIPLLPRNIPILVAYEDDQDAHLAVSDVLKGSLEPKGKLPIKLTPALDLQEIADKIWKNECGGKIVGLTSWNEGEGFPSLGIGHFIWYPKSKEERFQETFPELLAYLDQSGHTVPIWLKESEGCPWQTREEFLSEINSSKMQELRQLLIDSKEIQAKFIAVRLEKALPKIVESLSKEEQNHIKSIFQKLASEPEGLFALIDYVHFKGEGISSKERYKGQGWGLLQVLQGIPKNSKEILNDFVLSAKRVLSRRIENAPRERDEIKWLPGWHKRVESYLSK